MRRSIISLGTLSGMGVIESLFLVEFLQLNLFALEVDFLGLVVGEHFQEFGGELLRGSALRRTVFHRGRGMYTGDLRTMCNNPKPSPPSRGGITCTDLILAFSSSGKAKYSPGETPKPVTGCCQGANKIMQRPRPLSGGASNWVIGN